MPINFDIILTPNQGQQAFVNTTFAKFPTRDELIARAVELASQEGLQELVKISCCALCVMEKDCPEWYLEVNGKLYPTEDEQKKSV